MIKSERLPNASKLKGYVALGFVLVFLSAAGCHSKSQQETPDDAANATDLAPLRLLVIDDPEMATAIQREWLARAGREVVMRNLTTRQLLDGKSSRLGADVVVYPSGLIGHLATRGLIEPLRVESVMSSPPGSQDVFELSRLREARWGRETFAVPLGSPQLTLLYRADVFQKHGLIVPATWDEYRTLVERLADLQQKGMLFGGDGGSWNAVIEPLGPGWAGQVLLARAASYAKHRSQFSALFEYRTMKPLITGPAWTRAMGDLHRIADDLPSRVKSFAPSDVRSEFLSGRCAMAMTWPSRADDRSKGLAEEALQIGVAELPGSTAAYNYRSQQWENRGDAAQQHVTLLGVSGRLGSVTRECRQTHEAVNMLTWISGELSSQICPESQRTTLFRESHLGQATLWVDSQFTQQAATSYGEVVQQAMSRPGWLCSVRIPGRHRYLAALDKAVHAVLDGEASSEEALAAAAQTWEETTESLGRDKQREAYMRSIGLEP
ncbi:MAG: ABC transporter substrate-binding protein [Pirellulaceae bacterium]